MRGEEAAASSSDAAVRPKTKVFRSGGGETARGGLPHSPATSRDDDDLIGPVLIHGAECSEGDPRVEGFDHFDSNPTVFTAMIR